MNVIYVEADTFTTLYQYVFHEITVLGDRQNVHNKNVLEVGPAVLQLFNPRNRLLCFNKMRNIKRYCYGEALWYMSGSNKLEFIEKYSKFWKHISDDGITCNSAYGKYIFYDMYPTDDCWSSQWEYVRRTLQNDPTSRQAVIHIKPIQCAPTKDMVCTYVLQFSLRNNKLSLTVNMRSNDFYKGLTYDVFQFTLLQELMAAQLDVELGEYVHIANNLHIYEEDLDKIKVMIESGHAQEEILPPIPADFRCVDLPLLLAGLNPISKFAEEFKKYESTN